MNTEITIPCDEGDIVYIVDYDKPGHHVDLVKLDADLNLIGTNELDVKLPEDTYDYDKHEWETQLGRDIGFICACVDEGEEI